MADWLGTIRHDVLLVEDHLDTLAVTARLLRYEGFNVTTAASATLALRLAEGCASSTRPFPPSPSPATG